MTYGLDLSRRRAMFMTRTHAKYRNQRSVEAGLETEERTRPIALPSPLTWSVIRIRSVGYPYSVFHCVQK